MCVRAKKTERGIASYESSRIDNEMRKNSAYGASRFTRCIMLMNAGMEPE